LHMLMRDREKELNQVVQKKDIQIIQLDEFTKNLITALVRKCCMKGDNSLALIYGSYHKRMQEAEKLKEKYSYEKIESFIKNSSSLFSVTNKEVKIL